MTKDSGSTKEGDSDELCVYGGVNFSAVNLGCVDILQVPECAEGAAHQSVIGSRTILEDGASLEGVFSQLD